MSLLDSKEMILEGLTERWLNIIDSEELEKVLYKIPDVNICPKPKDIFNFARLTPLDEIKVIILGQDPYPNESAHGLSFSSLKKKIPPSLHNIYQCIKRSKLAYKTDKVFTGDLSNWSRQGVLLLNAALTTSYKKSSSHQGLWSSYVKKLLVDIQKRRKDIIFMLWGKFAQGYKDIISKDNVILEWSHPSPLAFKKDFKCCDHFIKANSLLFLRNERPIIWDTRIKMDRMDKDFMFENMFWFFYKQKQLKLCFTDGSNYSGDPKLGNKKSRKGKMGFASVFTDGSKLYGAFNSSKIMTSNIRAEGLAILKTMECVFKEKGVQGVCIITDSKFWIDMIEDYMPKWEMKGIKFSSKKNPDITIPLWKLYKTMRRERFCIKLQHMRAHNKDRWGDAPEGSVKRFCYNHNEQADELANEARKTMKSGQIEYCK